MGLKYAAFDFHISAGRTHPYCNGYIATYQRHMQCDKERPPCMQSRLVSTADNSLLLPHAFAYVWSEQAISPRDFQASFCKRLINSPLTQEEEKKELKTLIY